MMTSCVWVINRYLSSFWSEIGRGWTIGLTVNKTKLHVPVLVVCVSTMYPVPIGSNYCPPPWGSQFQNIELHKF